MSNTPYQVIVEDAPTGAFTEIVRAGKHELTADEPEAVGGNDRGPGPYELLLAALGTCTAMTIRMYARQKGWPLEKVTVRLNHARVHAEDCATCETREGKIDRMERVLSFEGPLTDQQRQRLLEIANKCPVHRTLTSEIMIPTRLLA